MPDGRPRGVGVAAGGVGWPFGTRGPSIQPAMAGPEGLHMLGSSPFHVGVRALVAGALRMDVQSAVGELRHRWDGAGVGERDRYVHSDRLRQARVRLYVVRSCSVSGAECQ